MPEQFQIPSDITNLGTTATSLTQNAANMAGGGFTVEDALKKAVNNAYAANQDIVKPLDEATTNYIASPGAASAQYQNIFNPFEKEKLVSKYIATSALPMLSLSNLYGSRVGRIDDIIRAGVGGWTAKTAAAQAAAEAAQTNYTNKLNEYLKTEDAKRANRQLDIDEYKATHPGGGGGGTGLEGMMTYFQEVGVNQDLNGDGWIGMPGIGVKVNNNPFVIEGVEDVDPNKMQSTFNPEFPGMQSTMPMQSIMPTNSASSVGISQYTQPAWQSPSKEGLNSLVNTYWNQ